MKKHLTILFLLLSITIVAQKRTYKIGILSDEYSPEIHNILSQKLEKEVKAVVGEDANIIFNKSDQLENNYNIAKAKENYQTLVKNCDIIISFGAFDNIIISKEKNFPKAVITIGGLQDKIITDAKKTSGIHNLTYIATSDNFSKDLKDFKELTDFKTVGIAIEKPLLKLVDFNTLLKKSTAPLQVNFKIIPFNNSNDIIANLNGIDALQLAGGFSLKTSEIQQLAKVLMEKKIPSFSSVRKQDVKNGIMATNQSSDDLNQFFRRIALSIESYVNGTNFSELPVLLNFNNKLTINFNTAQTVGVPMRYSLLGKTGFVGDIRNNPSAEKVYDLKMVINAVLGKNLSLKATEKGVLVSNQNVKKAKSNYLPKLTASATGTYIDPNIAKISNGQNPEIGTTGNLKLEQVVYSQSASANIDIQKSLAKAEQEKLNAQQLDLVFNGANAYFNTLILKTNLAIQMRNLALTEKNLQIAQENYKAGKSGKTDFLRFQSQKAQNTQALVEAVNRLRQGFLGINQLVNNNANEQINVKEASLTDEIFKEYNYDGFMKMLDSPVQREPLINFLVEEALLNAPELKQLNYNLNAVKRQEKLYGSGRFLPTVALQGQYNRQFSRSGEGSTFPANFPTPPDGNYNVALNISLPIFNQNTNKINKQTAIIQQEQLAINKENSELAISTNVRKGVLNLINQISNIELSKTSEKSAKEVLELTQTAYSTGAVNIVQLIDAQNNYLNAQQAKANATYNYLITNLQLERYIGYYFLLNTKQKNNEFNQRFLNFLNKNN